MKTKRNIEFVIILFFLSTIGSLTAFTQNNTGIGILKSKITHEEKIVKGVKNTTIESEEKYDQHGNVVDEIQYKDGKVDKHMVYEYNSENNKIKETEFDSSGKTKKIGEYKYENGIRTEKSIYDADKKLISKKTYTYTY
jgi:hypothetical protein